MHPVATRALQSGAVIPYSPVNVTHNLAAIAAAALGYWTAAIVLLAGVAVHGAGWFYLAAKAKAERPEDLSTTG